MSERHTPHTPGPWNYAEDELRPGRFSIYHNGPIAYCGDANPSCTGDGEANARLIAAAPALLDACKAALGFIESLPYEPSNSPSTRLQDLLHDLIEAVR